MIGVIASIAIPYLQRGIRAAENGNMFASLRTVASTEVNYFTLNSRFGRIVEINNILSGAIGTNSGADVIRGKFTISMVPAAPTDAELKNGYTITATRTCLARVRYMFTN